MRILLAIVHHWNPDGDGRHGSLRPDPSPRVAAFEQQLLALQRLGRRQAELNIASKEAQPANQSLQNDITIAVITDGEHHLIDYLASQYQGLYSLVMAAPTTPKHLGFEAQRFLASQIEEDFDFYGYLEDDLVIQDPCFFQKIDWFRQNAGDDCLLLPHRIELVDYPHPVDKFYIDGAISEKDLRVIVKEPSPTIMLEFPGGQVFFESPRNPHSGCFFLSQSQLRYWGQQSCWMDGDVSYISPLESAATLGISKTFKLFKPQMQQAGWLEIQHWGNSFHSLLGRDVRLPGLESYPQTDCEEVDDDSNSDAENDIAAFEK